MRDYGWDCKVDVHRIVRLVGIILVVVIINSRSAGMVMLVIAIIILVCCEYARMKTAQSLEVPSRVHQGRSRAIIVYCSVCADGFVWSV